MDVVIAQYLSLFIGLVMEEEIPQSLYLLRMVTRDTLKKALPNISYFRFVACAALRIGMGELYFISQAPAGNSHNQYAGYIFYLNMFVVVAQATAG